MYFNQSTLLIVNAFGKSQIPIESLPKASPYEAGESIRFRSPLTNPVALSTTPRLRP
jgi:hypothetical protein